MFALRALMLDIILAVLAQAAIVAASSTSAFI